MTARLSQNRPSLSVLALLCFLGGCDSRAARRVEGAIPQAEVQQGDLQLRITTTGLLKSAHTYPITAPAVGGANLQILRLPRTGAIVRKDEAVLEFDVSQQQYNLAQSRNELAQAEQEILKATADAEVQVAQDNTELVKTRFAVRKAELDVSKNEILSDIEGKKNTLALEEAHRALTQLETDIQSHVSSNQAGLLVSREKQTKARLAMKQAQENIEAMKVQAPASGILVVHGNESATGGMFFTGMTLPDFQVGDQVGPGTTVADVIDVAEMEIEAQVSETDRPMLKTGQVTEVQVDTIPGETFPGRISDITGAVNQEFWRTSAHSKFGVTIKLDHRDARLRPGFTVKLVLLGDYLPKVSWVPRQAVFERAEKKVVYVKHRGAWQEQEIKVRTYSEVHAVIEGLAAGTVVALADPEKGSSRTEKQENEGAPAIAPVN
jgi:multidrug resistance efflux pump